jgi:hypothetical protein
MASPTAPVESEAAAPAESEAPAGEEKSKALRCMVKVPSVPITSCSGARAR